MKKYSKRLLCSCISAIWFIGTYSLAGTTGMSITLAPGWNVGSTPAILSSLSFSNGGNGISFSKLVNEKRQTVSATTENIKPLEWFMVNNSNTSAVTLTMQYKAGVSVTESLLKSDLNQGRNLLGITTTDHPFAHLTGASMSVDFTNGTSQGVSSNFTINTTSKEVSNPQLWKAYGMFVNEKNAIYGGVNNGGIAIDGTSTWGTTSGGNTSTWTGTTGTGNSGEIWSGTTVTSGTNEGVIFQNKLNDVVIYSGSQGFWYNEPDEDVLVNYKFNGALYTWIMIASGNVNTSGNQTLNFTIESNETKSQIDAMWINIENNSYEWIKVKNGDKYKFTFENIQIFPTANFVIYFRATSYAGLDNLSRLTWNISFSVIDDENIGLDFRNISIQNKNLIEITNEDTPTKTVYQNEKSSLLVYSGTLHANTDFVVDNMKWRTSLVYHQWWYVDNHEENFHNKRFFHIYLDDQEIENSDTLSGTKGTFWAYFSKENANITINSWNHTLKIVEDILIPDLWLFLCGKESGCVPNRTESIDYLNWGIHLQNWKTYEISTHQWASIDVKVPQNKNILTGWGFEYVTNQGLLPIRIWEKCEIDGYSYNSCEIDSNWNKKIIVFSGTYAAKSTPITLTWFMVNHLTGNNFNNIHLNFELYINWNKVKEFGMSDINKMLNLDNLEITTEPATVKVLAIPTWETSSFQWSLTFYWTSSQWNWHDSIWTRPDVYSNFSNL